MQQTSDQFSDNTLCMTISQAIWAVAAKLLVGPSRHMKPKNASSNWLQA